MAWLRLASKRDHSRATRAVATTVHEQQSVPNIAVASCNTQMFNSRLLLMAMVAMAPSKLASLDYKKIQQWLKKYREYEVLEGTALMNKFIDKAQLLMLMLKAKRDITSLTARETFPNVEIEALLRSHNKTLSLNQSVKRLNEDVEFSLKGERPTSEELSNFYEDFEDAVISLGNSFKPENKVIKEIFVSKIKPWDFQRKNR